MQAQYKTYESYKDSGTKWLGMIPTDWDLQSIRAVTELKSQKNQPDLQVLSVYREYGVIQKDSRDDNHNVTSEDTSNYKAVAQGDLVVNKMKAWQGSMGVSEYQGIVSPAYITCKTRKDKILPRFLHFLLRSQPFISVYNALSYGVRIGQWDMHYEDFKKIALAYPSLPEQERIVSFLDQKTAEIVAAIEKKQRLIELLKEQKAIIINQAITKGLNPNVPMKDSGIEWIGKIPAHWEISKLRNILKPISIKNRPDLPLLSVVREKGIIIRDVDDLEENHNFIPEDLSGYKVVRKNQFAMNKMKAWQGSYGISDYDGIVSPAYYVFNVFGEIDKSFFHKAIRSQVYVFFFNNASDGVRIGQWDLSLERMKEIPFTYPNCKKEQKNIVDFIESNNSHSEKALSQIILEIEKLQEFKQTLIAHAVTGKIKV